MPSLVRCASVLNGLNPKTFHRSPSRHAIHPTILVDRDTLLRESDFVVATCALTEDTKVGHESRERCRMPPFFQRGKADVSLLNVSLLNVSLLILCGLSCRTFSTLIRSRS